MRNRPATIMAAKIENKLIYSPPGVIRLEGYSEGVATPNNQVIGPHPCFPNGLPTTDYEININLRQTSGGLITNPAQGVWISCENSIIVGHELTIPESTPVNTTVEAQAEFNVTVRKKSNVIDAVTGVVTSVLQARVKSGGVTPPDPGDLTPTAYAVASAIFDDNRATRPFAYIALRYIGGSLEVFRQSRRQNGSIQSEVIGTLDWKGMNNVDMSNVQLQIDVTRIYESITGTPLESRVNFLLNNVHTGPTTLIDNSSTGIQQVALAVELRDFSPSEDDQYFSHAEVEFVANMHLVGSPKGSLFRAAFIFFLDADYSMFG